MILNAYDWLEREIIPMHDKSMNKGGVSETRRSLPLIRCSELHTNEKDST